MWKLPFPKYQKSLSDEGTCIQFISCLLYEQLNAVIVHHNMTMLRLNSTNAKFKSETLLEILTEFYLKRLLSVRYRKVSKPRDLYLELSNRSEIWQASRQQCLPMCLSNFKAIWQFKVPISWLRDFTRSYEKTSSRILRRGPARCVRGKAFWAGYGRIVGLNSRRENCTIRTYTVQKCLQWAVLWWQRPDEL